MNICFDKICRLEVLNKIITCSWLLANHLLFKKYVKLFVTLEVRSSEWMRDRNKPKLF